MSGQHSPHDTGREENPVETDVGGIKSLPVETTLVSVVDALRDIERALKRIAENQWEIIERQVTANAYLNRLAQRH